jgi:hypothetical protein
VLTEGEYNSLWKSYVLSVVGNYLIEMLGTGGKLADVDEILELSGLKVGDYRPTAADDGAREPIPDRGHAWTSLYPEGGE